MSERLSPLRSRVMEVIHQPGECRPPSEGSVITIGVFDGVHRGHRQLIDRVRSLAAEKGRISAVVTFDPHPATVIRPEAAPKQLTDLDQKIELLAATGVDRTVIIHFDEERAHEAAEDFVDEVIVGCLDAKAVIVGKDFRFGHNRTGNVPLLTRMGAALGFDVDGVELYGADSDAHAGGTDEADLKPVSSTRVREALAKGDLVAATRMLGRPYQVRGVVGHGDKRGRKLGFPTANVEVPDKILLPADGVYAGWYRRPDGRRQQASISIGRRPTFYENADVSLLEAYVLDFEGDLYDERASVDLVARIRGQRRFSDLEDLVAAMKSDVQETRRVLG